MVKNCILKTSSQFFTKLTSQLANNIYIYIYILIHEHPCARFDSGDAYINTVRQMTGVLISFLTDKERVCLRSFYRSLNGKVRVSHPV